jgi:hypothetical protein
MDTPPEVHTNETPSVGAAGEATYLTRDPLGGIPMAISGAGIDGEEYIYPSPSLT